MPVSEAVQLNLITNVCLLLGLIVSGVFSVRSAKAAKSAADDARITVAGTEQAVADASAVRASMTTNNGGTHLKDWIDAHGVMLDRIDKAVDRLDGSISEVRRDVSGLHERMTVSEQQNRASHAACQTHLQGQIDQIRWTASSKHGE